MRIAITGASGFCGSAVTLLAKATGADVISLGRHPGPHGTHVPWDATRDKPDLAGADAVIHLAAAVGDQDRGPAAEAKFRLINVDAGARLLDAAGDRPVVWVSSASVYRPGPYPEAVREDHPIDGQRTAYGRTKAASERLALAAGAVVLRPRAVYGDGDRHLLPRLRRIVRAGRAWLPGPDVPLSLTAVENLADASLAALGVPPGHAGDAGRRWKPGAYNIADETAYRRDTVVAAVLEVPVRHVPLRLIRPLAALAPLLADKPALTPYAIDQLTDGMVLDIARARAEGWRPRRTLSDYLRNQRV
jgi:nucleoside-diphosphate-sugar epimerase